MRTVKTALLIATLLAGLPARGDDDNLYKAAQFRGSVPGVVLRDVASGGRAWVIASAKAKVDDEGMLKVRVEGLVFAPGSVINGVDVSGTTGPVTHFAATLSCIRADGTTASVTTSGFPATAQGDATIHQRIDLPPVCYAPVVLIRSFNPTALTAGAWFAATGF